jgi:hypothetical protein
MLVGIRVGVVIAALGSLIGVTASDVLSTSGFQDCGNGVEDVAISQFHLSFDRTTKELDFMVAGVSKVSQNVTGREFTDSLADKQLK